MSAAVAAVQIPESSASRRGVILALAAVYLIWGSTYLAMRVAVEGLPPFMMASARFVLTGTILLLFMRWRGEPWPTWRQWAWATPIGVLMFVLGNGTVALAEKNISSGIAAVICGTMPLCVAAMSRFFGEKVSVREWVAMAIGFTGVALLSFGKELRADPASAALVGVAPIAWGLGSLLARRLPVAKGFMSAATQMLTGGVVMAFVSLAAREQVPVAPPLKSVLAWVYLATFGSLIAYTAYSWLLTNTRPAVATSYSYVNPAIAVAIGVALGGEHAGPEIFAAVALIVVATVLVITRPAVPQPQRAAESSDQGVKTNSEVESAT
ncbi:MAG: drug/metabolite exporter YedA [Myxococcaceae bacterium]